MKNKIQKILAIILTLIFVINPVNIYAQNINNDTPKQDIETVQNIQDETTSSKQDNPLKGFNIKSDLKEKDLSQKIDNLNEWGQGFTNNVINTLDKANEDGSLKRFVQTFKEVMNKLFDFVFNIFKEDW